MPKLIYDCIYKYMEFDDILVKIIDTPEFQKLRNIKQLGLCYYIFPGASHNRFEHSLGVSYLCGLMIKTIQDKQPELNISDRTIILIKIAGLVHDIGHSCFSHFFDHHFLKDKIDENNPSKDHEYRSCLLFEYIVKKYNIGLTINEIDLVKRMIDPLEEDKSFIFQIVANKINGLDCDKLDYLVRDTYNIGLSYSIDTSRLIMKCKVIDNNIYFPEKCHFDIQDIYYTRYKLHKQIYTHPCVRALEYMVLDILNLTYNELGIIDRVLDISKFWELTDNILFFTRFSSNEKAKNILNRIEKRQMYKSVYETSNEENIKLIEAKLTELNLIDQIIIDVTKLNYSMNDKNPLDYICFYNGNKIINSNQKNSLLPKIFEEKIIRIYIKNLDIYNKIKDIINKII